MTKAIEDAARAMCEADDGGYAEGIWREVKAGAKHSGDCTKEPWTCLVCEVESYEGAAEVALKAALVITDEDVEAAAQAIAPAAWGGQDTLAQENRRKASLRNARAALQSFIDRKLGRTKLASRAGTSGRGTA